MRKGVVEEGVLVKRGFQDDAGGVRYRTDLSGSAA